MLGLHFSSEALRRTTRTFSSRGAGSSLVADTGCRVHRLSSCGAQALLVVVLRLSCHGSVWDLSAPNRD